MVSALCLASLGLAAGFGCTVGASPFYPHNRTTTGGGGRSRTVGRRKKSRKNRRCTHTHTHTHTLDLTSYSAIHPATADLASCLLAREPPARRVTHHTATRHNFGSAVLSIWCGTLAVTRKDTQREEISDTHLQQISDPGRRRRERSDTRETTAPHANSSAALLALLHGRKKE